MLESGPQQERYHCEPPTELQEKQMRLYTCGEDVCQHSAFRMLFRIIVADFGIPLLDFLSVDEVIAFQEDFPGVVGVRLEL